LKIVYFSYLYDIKGISAGSANKALGFIGGLRTLGHAVNLYWREVQPEAFEGDAVRLRIRRELKKRLARTLHDPHTLFKNFGTVRKDLEILRREKPDLLFLRSELYNVSAQIAARRLGIPVVLEADCPTAYEHRHMSSFDLAPLPVLPEWTERWNCRACGAIITISDVLKGLLMSYGVPASKITVVPNGADPDKFRPRPGSEGVRDSLGIPRGAVVIGWMQSGWGLSGVQTWIALARRILGANPKTAFLFIGGGKNQETIEKEFGGDPLGRRVVCTGTVPYDRVPSYVNALDIVTVQYPKSDLWYPSSMKLFECMAAGKPVVASAVPQVDEIIRDGWNGFLFEQGNMDEFVRKLLALAGSPALRAKFGRNARQTVLDSYTWAGQAVKMEAVFRKVLTDRSRIRPSGIPKSRIPPV
jgi:glycosyltransferase involved in cell wall biosynthesis